MEERKKRQYVFQCASAGGWFTCQKSGIFKVEVSSQGLIHAKHLRNGRHKKLRRKRHVKHRALFPQTNFENTMLFFFFFNVLVTTEILVVNKDICITGKIIWLRTIILMVGILNLNSEDLNSNLVAH